MSISSKQKSAKTIFQNFNLLRESFVRTSVPANIRALQADTEERITKYNNMETEEDPGKQTKVLPLQDQDKLNPIFSDFC